MIRLLALGALALAAVPAQADESAQQRLDRCLVAGATNAKSTQLTAAVIAVRSFCGAQLRRVREERATLARRGLSGDAADKAEQQAIRKLNTEVAVTVARLTGLKP